jgi:predicted DNA-binding protein (UPF0251 family)
MELCKSMGNPAGVQRDFDALEKRRFAAMRLLDKGLNQTEVAGRVKVVRQTVARGQGNIA